MVKIYVENQLLDLFGDESITVTSSVQNISDISKVFTDFSQSFTIPCTPNNNYIFEHYYQSDVDNTIDHNRRRDAYIEIDTQVFREGKIQLEKSEIKNNEPESYTVTFFGTIVNLKDLIGEDKLKDLDFTSLDHDYTGAEILSRINTNPATTDYDVKYPLISSNRVWQYGDASANDITTTAGAIKYTELFPAVRVKSILARIEDKYGITFTGSFMDLNRFKKLFMWFKNRESIVYYSQPKTLRFAIGGTSTNVIYESEVRSNYITPSSLVVAPYDFCSSTIIRTTSVTISTGSAIDYLLDIYINGVYSTSMSGNGTQSFVIANDINGTTANRTYTFKLRSTAAMTFSCTIDYSYSYTLMQLGYSSSTFTYSETSTSATSFTTVVKTDLTSLAPDMKVSDFLSGLFNTYNLTCVGNSTTDYQIEPLETFYNKGRVWQLDQYVITDSIEIARPKLYNKISFEWQQSNSFMNREFYALFGREYGNLSYIFGYDGGDYAIQLPFETLLHTKFSSSGMHVGYCLGSSPEYKNYVPKPVLLYEYTYATGQSYKFFNGSTTSTQTTYIPFGQDTLDSSKDYTLNFGSEFSSMTLTPQTNTLYQQYYEKYLENLFNLKTRLVTVKCILPMWLLNDIRLNDSIFIRDKRYVINEMQSNLTNGEVTFTLVSSFRDDSQFAGTFILDNTAQTISIPYSLPENTTVTIVTPPLEGGSFCTISDTTPTGDQVVTITTTSNGTASVRYNTFPVTIVRDGITTTQYIAITQLA